MDLVAKTEAKIAGTDEESTTSLEDFLFAAPVPPPKRIAADSVDWADVSQIGPLLRKVKRSGS